MKSVGCKNESEPGAPSRQVLYRKDMTLKSEPERERECAEAKTGSLRDD